MTAALDARVVAEARRWIGTPYVHQASTRARGCDCLGFVRGVWRATVGAEPLAMPAYTRDWGEVAGDEHLLGIARRHLVETAGAVAPGEVLLFRWSASAIAKHMGIATSRESFIHAWERAGVVEVALVPQWRRRIAAKFRFPEPSRVD